MNLSVIDEEALCGVFATMEKVQTIKMRPAIVHSGRIRHGGSAILIQCGNHCVMAGSEATPEILDARLGGPVG